MSTSAAATERVPEQMPSLLIEAFANHATPAALRFVLGERIETLTVGTDGDWRVDAPGVAAIHAALHFNGTTLYVVGRPESPVYVDGRCVGNDWFQVTAPATIEFGAARLDVYDFNSDSPYDRITTPGGPAVNAKNKVSTHPESAIMRRVERTGNEEPSTDVVPMALVFAAIDEAERRERSLRLAAEDIDIDLRGLAEVKPLRRTPLRVVPQPKVLERETVASAGAAEVPLRLPLSRQLPIVVAVLATLMGLCIGFVLMSFQPPASSTPTTAPKTKHARPVRAVAKAHSAAPPLIVIADTPITVGETRNTREAERPRENAAQRERRAITALWNGDRREALRLYERLARDYPDVITYREAVHALKRRKR